LIILLDDYAIDEEFRNNLSALYLVEMSTNKQESKKQGMEIKRVFLYPIKCENMQMNLLATDDEDFWWIAKHIQILSEKMGNRINFKQSDNHPNSLEIEFFP
jgi:hypothetical protein